MSKCHLTDLLTFITSNQDHLAELKERATEQIDVGNRKLGLDMIPRNSRGEVITTADTTVMEMYRVHLEQVRCRIWVAMHRVTHPQPVLSRLQNELSSRCNDEIQSSPLTNAKPFPTT